MGGFKDENAITYRLGKMQTLWSRNVKEDTQLVRWLIDTDEKRMVQAFAITEASPQGRIPELFINFQDHFTSFETYGQELTHSFITLYNSEEARKEVGNAVPQWDDAPYKNVPAENSHQQFVNCMASFAKAISTHATLIIHIMPTAYDDYAAFIKWVKQTAPLLPCNLKLMITDAKQKPQFNNLPDTIKEVVLEPNLNMHEAMREIVSGGDTNDPVININLCLLNMMEALKGKDLKQLNHWAKEGNEIAKKTTLKSLEATVAITYGSALYQLKKLEDALTQFQHAEECCLAGAEDEDHSTCKVLLIQAYNFQAATYHYKKKKEKAAVYYYKTAVEAQAQGNHMTYLEAMRMSAYMEKKNHNTSTAIALLKEAYNYGDTLELETQKFSSMHMICKTLYELLETDSNEDQFLKELEAHAETVWGDSWQDLSEKDTYQNILKQNT